MAPCGNYAKCPCHYERAHHYRLLFSLKWLTSQSIPLLNLDFNTHTHTFLLKGIDLMHFSPYLPFPSLSLCCLLPFHTFSHSLSLFHTHSVCLTLSHRKSVFHSLYLSLSVCVWYVCVCVCVCVSVCVFLCKPEPCYYFHCPHLLLINVPLHLISFSWELMRNMG